MAGQSWSEMTALAVKLFLESLILAYWKFEILEYVACFGCVWSQGQRQVASSPPSPSFP